MRLLKRFSLINRLWQRNRDLTHLASVTRYMIDDNARLIDIVDTYEKRLVEMDRMLSNAAYLLKMHSKSIDSWKN